MKKEIKFKINDWVYCSNPNVHMDDYVMQVLDIDNEGWLGGIMPDGRKDGHHYSHYRYATDKEISKVTGMDIDNYEIY